MWDNHYRWCVLFGPNNQKNTTSFSLKSLVQISIIPRKKMKIALFLALCVGVAVADPRGSTIIRGHSTRKLQKDNMGGGGKEDVVGGGGADKLEDAAGGDSEGAGSIVEIHSCIADAQAALNFISGAGSAAASDQSCYADPVNGCEGGCCRLGNWLVGTSLSSGNATTMGNATTVGNTTAEAPSATPLTPEEFAALYPEVLNNIAIQESAPLPNGDPSTATTLVDAEDGEEEAKKDKRVRILKHECMTLVVFTERRF
jgi:hypothetical protein